MGAFPPPQTGAARSGPVAALLPLAVGHFPSLPAGMKIALDAMGGDFAPRNMLAGAQQALAAYPAITTLYLVGDAARLKAEMDGMNFSDSRAVIVHASEVVEMTDSAVKSLRQKKDSSISVATDLVKRGDAQAVSSPGHTGAAWTPPWPASNVPAFFPLFRISTAPAG